MIPVCQNKKNGKRDEIEEKQSILICLGSQLRVNFILVNLMIYFQITLGASAVRGNKDSSGDPKKKYFVWKTYSDGTKVKEYIDKDQIQDYTMSKKGKFDGDDQVNIS